MEYIERQKEKYDEGDAITVSVLMQSALNKFMDRKRDNKWQAPSADEQKIVALTAQVEKLKKTKTPGRARNQESTRAPNRRDEEKFAWKKVKPTASEKGKTKTMNEKVYHWCKKHVAWTLHSAEKCRLKEPETIENEPEEELTMNQAMQAILDGADDESNASVGSQTGQE